MSELIKRDDVCREIQHSFDLGSFRWQDGQDLLDRINALPTIDAVPVVRCGECKHWDGLCWRLDGHGVNFTDPNGFCSYGEKEETL